MSALPDLSGLAAPRYRLADARVPACLLPDGLVRQAGLAVDAEGLARVDIAVEHGRLARIAPAGHPPPPAGDDPAGALPRIALGGRLVLPGLVDSHTHLDKAFIWSRAPNPDGSFQAAIAAASADALANWSTEDLRRRMNVALRCAHAHGTVALRSHLDSFGAQTDISWGVFAELRTEWAGRVALQGVSLCTIDMAAEPDALAPVVAAVRRDGGVLGAFLYPSPKLAEGLEALFDAAERHGLDLDFHADETHDPAAQGLLAIARIARRRRFGGRILVGHCCSLAGQDAVQVDRTLDEVAGAGLAVVSLPLCNLYLQDRAPGRTPRWRGVTLLHEMKARGIEVMVASDNVRDPFYPHGDFDMIEIWREASRILHLDHPVGDWPRIVGATPAGILGLDAGTLRQGGRADLVITGARSVHGLFARPGTPRLVVRDGRPSEARLPDLAELEEEIARP